MKKILSVFFILNSCLWSVGQGLRLSGKIVDSLQQGLAAVKVVVYPPAKTVFTDAAGQFSFTGLATGIYELRASLDGYQQQRVQVKVDTTMQSMQVVLHATARHELQEVIVYDNHIENSKRQDALNVEVVTPAFVQRNLGGSLMKTLERLPGIKTIGIGSGQSKPLIRGLGFNRVVVVEKGVKHEGQQWGADHGLEIDQFAAGEVALIKGAASFIYGSDAIGGAIDVKPVPPPPQHTLGGSVNVIGKTNNNLYGTSVNLYGRSQYWFFDGRLTYQNYADYRVPVDRIYVYDYAVDLYKNHLRNTAGNETGLHLNTGYISERFRSIFYVSNVYSKSGFFANAHGLEPRRVDAVLHDRSSRDILMPHQQVNHLKIINHSKYRLSGHKLEVELGFQRNFRQEYSQYVNHGYMPPVYPDSMRIPATLERQFDKHVYAANLRDNIVVGKHTITVGANAEHQNNGINGWSFLVPAFTQTTVGAFAYDKYKLNDQVLLHGAIRYDHGHINMLEYKDWFNSDVVVNGVPLSEKLSRANNLNRRFNSLVWSVGINYNTKEYFSLKANIGKSFRMPITKELGANGVNYHYFSYERGNAALSPEQSYQADLSLAWNTDRLMIQMSPFYNYFPNYIYLNPTAQHDYFYGAGNQVFQYEQSRVMRYGGELQVKYQLAKTLSTEVLAEYLYARQLSGNKKGYTLPFSPPPSVLLNFTWSPTGNGRLQNNYLSLDYRLTAAQNNIVPPEKKTPGYGLMNIQAGTKIYLHHQPVMVSLQVQNALNTRYLNHTSFYRLIELPEAGRNIILSLKVPFAIHAAAPKK